MCVCVHGGGSAIRIVYTAARKRAVPVILKFSPPQDYKLASLPSGTEVKV